MSHNDKCDALAMELAQFDGFDVKWDDIVKWYLEDARNDPPSRDDEAKARYINEAERLLMIRHFFEKWD